MPMQGMIRFTWWYVVIMVTKEDMLDDYDHQGEGHESYWSVGDNDQ